MYFLLIALILVILKINLYIAIGWGWIALVAFFPALLMLGTVIVCAIAAAQSLR